MVEQAKSLYAPKHVSHPGEMLSEYLESYEWTQRELARRTGLTPKTISDICNRKAPVSASTSLALEKVFQRPAHFWLALQRRYDEFEARRQSESLSQEWEHWASRFPLREMQHFGYIEDATNGRSKAEILLRFFGVSSPESWQSVWNASRIAFRQTRKGKTSQEAVSSWIRATEIAASQVEAEVHDFDRDTLLGLIDKLKNETTKPAETFIPNIESMCAQAGVIVVWVPELPNAAISGCARWLSDRRALLGMTLRYKFDDQIWFTFFHELGHILLHKRKHGFILDNADDDLTDNVVDPNMRRQEEEANRFAADTLIPPKQLSAFLANADFSNEAILGFARELKIGPGIVVGRLQREGVIGHFQGNALKRRFDWTFADG